MRLVFEILLYTFLLLNYNEAGLVQRRSRNLDESPVVEAALGHLEQNKIPVTVIEVKESESIVDGSKATLATDDKIATQEQIAVVPPEATANQAQELVGSEIDTELGLRQVTAATPVQSSTPQNFVQFIQNSPLAQFISQLTGNQQQAVQSQSTDPIPAEGTGTPVLTIPGFLNPSTALTSAQQAVQNTAQFVGNTTTQAFQGIQQFATNLGTQFQNTLSNLGGQQNQLTTSDSTTTRPPGPIQSIVNNFVGSNNNQATDQQQQGPLQGLLSFFQGGNRPTAAPVKPAEQPVSSPDKEPAAVAQVDNKIDEQQDAVQLAAGSTNEVRTSAEVAEDSFEVARPDELIVVHDEANQ